MFCTSTATDAVPTLFGGIARFGGQRVRPIGHRRRVPRHACTAPRCPARRATRRPAELHADHADVVAWRSPGASTSPATGAGGRASRYATVGACVSAAARSVWNVCARRRPLVVRSVARLHHELIQRVRRQTRQRDACASCPSRAVDLGAGARRAGDVGRPSRSPTSLVVNVIVALVDVMFGTATLVICGAVVSGASGPSAAHRRPVDAAQPWRCPANRRRPTMPTPSLKRQ